MKQKEHARSGERGRMTLRGLGISLVLAGFMVMLMSVAPGGSTVVQAVDGIEIDGNPKCADFGSYEELKFDPNPVGDGPFTDDDGTLEVTITNATEFGFTWESNIGVSIVIIKGGNDPDAVYFDYEPGESTGDTLTFNSQNAISHISFCYDEDDPELGAITANKECTEFDGDAEFEFTLFDSEDNEVESEDSNPQTVGCNEAAFWDNLPEGSYYVDETGSEPGWTEDSNDCEGLDPLDGENNTCTITNSPPVDLGSIGATKACTEADAEAQFTFTLFDASDDSVVGTDTVGCGEQALFENLSEGTYYVQETAIEEGWTEDSNNCQDLDPFENNTCTITNSPPDEEPEASITIRKEVPGTDPQNFDFDDNIGPCNIDDLDDDPNSATPKSVTCTVSPGTYTVSENLPNGWFLDDIDCSGSGSWVIDVNDEEVVITVDDGESVTCTFFNDEEDEDFVPTPVPTEEVQQIVVTPTPVPPTPVAEVEAVVEEVAALPSTGSGGPSGGSGFAWSVLAGLVLVSLGGGALYAARKV